MNKEKILFVVDNMKIGGIQKNMLNSLVALHDRFDITLCLFNAVGDYINMIPEDVRVIELDSPFHTLGMSNAEAKRHFPTFVKRCFYYLILKLFGNEKMYRAMLKRQKHLGTYDYAVSGMQSAVWGVFFSGCNELILERVDAKQKVAYIHCDYVKSGIDNPYNRSVYRRLDKILVPNESNRDQLLSVMPDLCDKTYTVNNFCNYEEVRKKANIDTVEYDARKINIATVARISPEKGIDRAIEACRRLKGEDLNFTYHVVGGGGNYAELCEYVDSCGLSDTVFLHGYDANPYRYLKNVDLFLLPSRHEAAGLVIDEARSLSVPVLSTATVAAEETIGLHNCGWVCENSEDGIYEGLLELLRNPDLIREKRRELDEKECNNDIPIGQFCDMLSGKGEQ